MKMLIEETEKEWRGDRGDAPSSGYEVVKPSKVFRVEIYMDDGDSDEVPMQLINDAQDLYGRYWRKFLAYHEDLKTIQVKQKHMEDRRK